MTASPHGAAASCAAAVDIGSTSVHLLVGCVGSVASVGSLGGVGSSSPGRDGRVEPLLDTSELLGLGGRIQADGMLGVEGRRLLAATLARQATAARALGVERIVFAGTDPLRHAADAARACSEIEQVTGVAVHVLDQDEEGALTLLGVTAGRSISDDLAVVDIGGGSTEIIVAGAGGIRQVIGLPVGASRLTVGAGAGDPPSPADMATLRAEARRVLRAAPDLILGEVVAVGGTAYGLSKIVAGPGGLERVIDRDGLRRAMALIATESSEDVAEAFRMNPRRTRILAAGGAIVEALLERYGIERIEASPASMREGLVLALVRDGAAWRDRLRALVRTS